MHRCIPVQRPLHQANACKAPTVEPTHRANLLRTTRSLQQHSLQRFVERWPQLQALESLHRLEFGQLLQEPQQQQQQQQQQQAMSQGNRGQVFPLAPQLAAALLASIVSMQLCCVQPAAAHIGFDKPLRREPAVQSSITAGFDPAEAAAVRGPAPSPNSSSSSSSRPRSPVASAAADALQQLTAAQEAAKAGDYQAALARYNQVVQQHPDLALSEYARLGRAIMLYEVGDASKSLIALEDQEVSMRGYPEAHAALAAVLYCERPAQRLRAEQQFDIALEFDPHFQDMQWVAQNKHWGPRMLGALEKFLLLQ